MPDLPRSHLVAYAVAAVVVLVFGAREVSSARKREGSGGGGGAEPIAVQRSGSGDGGGSGSGGRVVVHVAGEVLRPGVYRLRAGARVDDAVRRAGGARRRADLTQVNLAQKLEDGRQIIVPARAPPVTAAGSGSSAVPAAPASTPRRSSSWTRCRASARSPRSRSSTSARRTAASRTSRSSTRCRGSARRRWPRCATR